MRKLICGSLLLLMLTSCATSRNLCLDQYVEFLDGSCEYQENEA